MFRLKNSDEQPVVQYYYWLTRLTTALTVWDYFKSDIQMLIA